MRAESASPFWASESFWKKAAVWVTAFMFAILIVLTFDTMASISEGGDRAPAYSVVNREIFYRFDPERNVQAPVVGGEAPLFGRKVSEDEAREWVSFGKKIVQGRNCMNCHTLLGNGAYYAPDLTKSWLDPAWGPSATREKMMIDFLIDPVGNRRGFGGDRKMPDLGIDKEEAQAIVAFLKWMAAIDTNGFPYNFPTAEGGER